MANRKINPCKLIKEQLKPDLLYAMARARITGREAGFSICEMPKTGQWVAGYRSAGGAQQVKLTVCEDLPKISGRKFKQVATFHVHPPDPDLVKRGVRIEDQSMGDAYAQQGLGEKLSCVASAGNGRMNCYRILSKSAFKKIDKLPGEAFVSNDPAYNKYMTPILESGRVCSIQVEEVSRIKRLTEKIKKPERPPLRF